MSLKLWQIAYADYQQGWDLEKIATKYEVTVQTVKLWSRKYWRQLDTNNGKFPPAATSPTKRPRGAPKGSQNAKGHGAPRGNQNAKGNRGGKGGPFGNTYAEKTGEYTEHLFSKLNAEEVDVFQKLEVDPILQTKQTIRLLTAREYYMLSIRDELLKQRELAQSESNNQADLYEDVAMTKEKRVGDSRVLIHKEQRFSAKLLAMEEALTRVQEKKLRALESLQRMLNDKVKIEISGPNGKPVQTQQNSDVDLSRLSKDEITALVTEVFSNESESDSSKN